MRIIPELPAIKAHEEEIRYHDEISAVHDAMKRNEEGALLYRVYPCVLCHGGYHVALVEEE